MKIFDKDRFQTPMKFAGVLLAKGEKLNDFLRSIEPPSHNAWEPGRTDADTEYAKATLKKLYGWVNDKVHLLGRIEDNEELDVEGINRYLPDDLDEASPSSQSSGAQGGDGIASEGVNKSPKEIEIKTIIRSAADEVKAAGDEAAAYEEGEEEGAERVNVDDEHGVDREPKEGPIYPVHPENVDENGRGGSTADHTGNHPAPAMKPIKLRNLRSYCIDPDSGKYIISFEPEVEGEGRLNINIVGEVGAEAAPLLAAQQQETGEIIAVSDGRLGPFVLKKDVRNTLVVSLKEPLRCALEVSANVN
jgi:hypothetical protein